MQKNQNVKVSPKTRGHYKGCAVVLPPDAHMSASKPVFKVFYKNAICQNRQQKERRRKRLNYFHHGRASPPVKDGGVQVEVKTEKRKKKQKKKRGGNHLSFDFQSVYKRSYHMRERKRQ